jgi:hypothetical protein
MGRCCATTVILRVYRYTVYSLLYLYTKHETRNTVSTILKCFCSTQPTINAMKKRVAPLHQCDAFVLRRSICIVVLLFVVALETFLECKTEESTVVASTTDDVDGNAGMIRLAAKNNSTASYNKFGFFLMGDIPYANWELKMLDQQVEALNHNQTKMDHLRFTVHVGDFQKVDRTMCAETHYELVASKLQAGNLPTVMIPGDNDW